MNLSQPNTSHTNDLLYKTYVYGCPIFYTTHDGKIKLCPYNYNIAIKIVFEHCQKHFQQLQKSDWYNGTNMTLDDMDSVCDVVSHGAHLNWNKKCNFYIEPNFDCFELNDTIEFENDEKNDTIDDYDYNDFDSDVDDLSYMEDVITTKNKRKYAYF